MTAQTTELTRAQEIDSFLEDMGKLSRSYFFMSLGNLIVRLTTDFEKGKEWNFEETVRDSLLKDTPDITEVVQNILFCQFENRAYMMPYWFERGWELYDKHSAGQVSKP
jgi:hypothetical protein